MPSVMPHVERSQLTATGVCGGRLKYFRGDPDTSVDVGVIGVSPDKSCGGLGCFFSPGPFRFTGLCKREAIGLDPERGRIPPEQLQ